MNHNKNERVGVDFERLDLNTRNSNFTKKKSTDYNSLPHKLLNFNDKKYSVDQH